MNTLDWTVIRTAATAGLLVLVPGALGASVLFEGPGAALSWLFAGVVLVGFSVAGYVAGRLRPDTPMLHGAISGLVAFVVAQLFGLVVLLANGDRIVWVAVPLTAMLAASFGVAGALLSDLVHRRTLRAS